MPRDPVAEQALHAARASYGVFGSIPARWSAPRLAAKVRQMPHTLLAHAAGAFQLERPHSVMPTIHGIGIWTTIARK